MADYHFSHAFFKTFDEDYLKSSVRALYSAYKVDSNHFQTLFRDCFSLSVPLVFGFGVSDYEVMIYLLRCYYRNEMFIKHSFLLSHCTCGCKLVMEEYPCLGSRVDIAGIGCKSFAYEIKTHYDNLDRLGRQVSDYLKCFERVFVVCCDDKVATVVDMIPEECGVISYSDDCRCLFRTVRDCLNDSPSLSAASQISCMRSADLRRVFKTTDSDAIVKNFKADVINESFKDALHRRMAAISSR